VRGGSWRGPGAAAGFLVTHSYASSTNPWIEYRRQQGRMQRPRPPLERANAQLKDLMKSSTDTMPQLNTKSLILFIPASY
jgi:hypothetical protein